MKSGFVRGAERGAVRAFSAAAEEIGYTVIRTESAGRHPRIILKASDGFEFFSPILRNVPGGRHFIMNWQRHTKKYEQQARLRRNHG